MPFMRRGQRASCLMHRLLSLVSVAIAIEHGPVANISPYAQAVQSENQVIAALRDMDNMYKKMYAKTSTELKALAHDAAEQYREYLGQLQALVWTHHAYQDKQTIAHRVAHSLKLEIEKAHDGGSPKDTDSETKLAEAYRLKAKRMCLAEWLLCTEGLKDVKLSVDSDFYSNVDQADMQMWKVFSPTSWPTTGSEGESLVPKKVQLDVCICRKSLCDAGTEAVLTSGQIDGNATSCAQTDDMQATPSFLDFLTRRPWPFEFQKQRHNHQIQQLARVVHTAQNMEKEHSPAEFLPRHHSGTALAEGEHLEEWRCSRLEHS